jgi:type IV secretory pathway TrbF-like protein
VRIDSVGRAEAVKYDTLTYKPQSKEVKHFLAKFCKHYYQKNKYTIQTDFDTFVKFLDGDLANSIIDVYKNNHTIETYLKSSTADDVEIKINKIIIDNLENEPYKASVDFQKIYITPREKKVRKIENYTASIVFVIKDEISEEDILFNPLGLTIVNLHEDKAFK